MGEMHDSGAFSDTPDLPGYAGLEVIGRGGFSTVYSAREVAFNRDVAIKIMDIGNMSDDALLRFERECKAVGSLSGHPNIVTVYGAGSTRSGLPYIVMDLAQKGSLTTRLKNDGAMTPQEAAHAGLDLADAVAAAHEIGIVHRDIKPDNVFISRYGRLQLGDFGISSIPDGYETTSGDVTATMAYAAPEVIDGDRATPSSDIYSLAATITSLILGGPVFARGRDEQLVSFIHRVLTEDPRNLEPYGASAELSTVLRRGMAKDASHRYASAEEFRADLMSVPESGIIAGGPPAVRTIAQEDLHPEASFTVMRRGVVREPTGDIDASLTINRNADAALAKTPVERKPVAEASTTPPAIPPVQQVEPGFTSRSPQESRSRRGLLWGAVAGVVIVVAIVITAVSLGGSKHPALASPVVPVPTKASNTAGDATATAPTAHVKKVAPKAVKQTSVKSLKKAVSTKSVKRGK